MPVSVSNFACSAYVELDTCSAQNTLLMLFCCSQSKTHGENQL